MAEQITVVANLIDRFSGTARRVINRIDELGEEAKESSDKFDLLEDSVDRNRHAATRAESKMQVLGKRISTVGKESTKTARQVKVLDLAMDRLEKTIAKRERRQRRTKKSDRGSGIGGGAGGGMMMMGGGVGGMPITMALGVMTIIAALLPMISSLLGALSAAAMGAIGALSPVVGAIVPATGALLGFALGLGSVVVAMRGFGEAVSAVGDSTKSIHEVRAAFAGFNKETGINPANQLVRDFGRLGVKMDVVQRILLKALVPGLREMASAVDTVLPIFADGLYTAGIQVSNLSKQFAAFLKTSYGQKQLNTILQTSASSLSGLGRAAYGGFRVVLDLLEAAGPVIIRMTNDLGRFFDKLAVSTTTNKNGLAQFFERSYVVLQKLVKFTGDLFKALYNVGKIGVPLGSAMGDSFLEMTQRFREFTESADGIQKIRDWFIQMTPLVYELGRFLVDIVGLFARIGQDQSFLVLSENLRSQVLPILEEFIARATKDLLPALLALAVAALEFFNALQLFTILTPMFEGMAVVIKAIATVLDAGVQITDSFRLSLGLVIGVAAAFLFTVKLMSAAMLLLRMSKIRTIMAAKQLAVYMPAVAKGMGVATAGTVAFGAALRFLLLAAGPIGILLTVIGLAAGAIMGMSDSVEENIEANRQWAESLFAVNGALVENAAHTAALKLAQEGAFELADQLGISHADLVTAVLNGGDAYDQLVNKLGHIRHATKDATDDNISFNNVLDGSQQAADNLYKILNPMKIGIQTAGEAARAAAPFIGALEEPMDRLARATANAVRDLQRLRGMLEKDDEMANWRQSLMRLNDAWKESPTFSKFTEEGERNLSNLRANFNSAIDIIDSYIEKGNDKGALKMVERQVNAMKGFLEVVPEDEQGPIRRYLKQLQRYRRSIERQIEAEGAIQLPVGAELNVPFVGEDGIARIPMAIDLPKNWRNMPGPLLEGQLYPGGPIMSEFGIDLPPNWRNMQGPMVEGQLYPGGPIIIPIEPAPPGEPVQVPTPDAPTVTVNVDDSSVTGATSSVGVLRTETQNATDQKYTLTVAYPTITDLQKAISSIMTQMVNLTSRTWTVKVETTYTSTGRPPRRAEGGPIDAGLRYIVGERGPEAFIGRSGNVSMIGVHGQESRKFNEDGWVVPNHQLAAAMATTANEKSSSREYAATSTPTVQIGTINAHSEFDVVKAVKKGIQQAERSRRERS